MAQVNGKKSARPCGSARASVRRLLLLTATVALLGTLTACGASGDEAGGESAAAVEKVDGPTVDVNVGYLTDVNSVMAAAVIHRLEQTRLFEKTAAERGFNVNVSYKQFPFAPPLIADAQTGGVHIGTIATYPILLQLQQNQKVRPLHVSFGGWRFLLVVRKDGSIRDFDDLRGKTVGLARGTTLEQFFNNFVQTEMGQSPKELGIKTVEQALPVAAMPPGMDAMVTYVPGWLTVEQAGNLEVLVDSFGKTGEAYEGPLGSGAGHTVPSVSDSPLAPEGYVALRHMFSAFGGFDEKHPEVIEAWLVAYQQTLRELNGQSPSEISALFPEELWKTMPRKPYEEQAIAEDLLYRDRDWIWPTEGDIEIMEKEAPEGVDRARILDAFEPNLELLEKAYNDTGSYPESDVFTEAGTRDKRGMPVWAVER
jgi:ABC-type nitrate/sulfonate/bicarbonate transport system substrate-binding protein